MVLHNNLKTVFALLTGVTTRDVKTLKVYYDNMKRKARKLHADDKVAMNATGGGQFSHSCTDTSEKIMSLIQPTITPFPNINDSDAVYQGDYITEEINIEPAIDGAETFPIIFAVEGTSGELALPLPRESTATATQCSPLPTLPTGVAAPTTGMATVVGSRSSSPSRPKKITARPSIMDSCKKRIAVLDEELKMMKVEHNKEMEIKEMKLCVLKEKQKYWVNKNKEKGFTC